jgi:hypothetical protein
MGFVTRRDGSFQMYSRCSHSVRRRGASRGKVELAVADPMAPPRVLLQVHPVRVKLERGGLTVPLFGPPNVDKLVAKGDVSGLIDALEYPVPWRVRPDAALALGAMGGTDAVEPLIAALGNDHASVCLAATRALGKIGAPGSVEPPTDALGSRAVEIRKAATDSLDRGERRCRVDLLQAQVRLEWVSRSGAIGPRRDLAGYAIALLRVHINPPRRRAVSVAQ